MFVRRIIAADLDEIVELARQFHAESPYHSRLNYVGERVRELVEAATRNPDWLAIVACEESGEIVGMGLFYCALAFFSDEIEAGDLTLWVAPEKRGTRCAHLLLREYVDWARAKGAARLQMGLTTGINQDAAEAFFRRAGFKREGVLLSL